MPGSRWLATRGGLCGGHVGLAISPIGYGLSFDFLVVLGLYFYGFTMVVGGVFGLLWLWLGLSWVMGGCCGLWV